MKLENFKSNKSLILATAVFVALAFCGIDNLGPVGMATGHADAPESSCLADSCLTLTSKDASSPARTAGFILLLFLGLTAGFSGHFLQAPSLRLLFAKDGPPPKVSNKLYQLHAAYLL